MQIQRNHTLIAAVAVAILAVACIGGAYALTSEVSVDNKVNAETLSADIYDGDGNPISEPFLLSGVSTEIEDKGAGYYGFKESEKACDVTGYTLKANYSSDSKLKLKMWVSSDDPSSILAFRFVTINIDGEDHNLYSSDMGQWAVPVEIEVDSNTPYDMVIKVRLSRDTYPFDSLDEAEDHLDVGKLVFNFVFTTA